MKVTKISENKAILKIFLNTKEERSSQKFIINSVSQYMNLRNQIKIQSSRKKHLAQVKDRLDSFSTEEITPEVEHLMSLKFEN